MLVGHVDLGHTFKPDELIDSGYVFEPIFATLKYSLALINVSYICRELWIYCSF